MLALAVRADPVLARDGPVQLGAAVNTGGFLADPDPRYRETLAGYDAITAESAMKILDLEPERDVWQFGTADAMVDFAISHGQQVHGHTLTWCEDTWLPSWLRDRSWKRADLLGVLDDYITKVLAHFHGRVSSWDVVNEAFNADGTMRDCLWYRVIGPDWVERALRLAHEADPTVKLFYNEIRAEVPNPKFDAVLAMVRDFRVRGVPLDGVGEQMHFVNGAPPQDQMEAVIKTLGDLGLAVHISELDVPTWYLGSTLDEKLTRQAESYRAVAAACEAQPACFRITTWGFTDRYTWRGTNSMPLPFDVDYRPKPAWMALKEALIPPPPGPPPVPPPSAPPAPAAGPVRLVVTSRPRYRGSLIDVSGRRRRHPVRGERQRLSFEVRPGRMLGYRLCVQSRSLRQRRCFIRSTTQAGRSTVDLTRLLGRPRAVGRWRAVWRVHGRRVALWQFTVAAGR